MPFGYHGSFLESGSEGFLQQATGDLVLGAMMVIVPEIVRLDQFIHHTPLGDGELKQVGLVDLGGGYQSVFFKGKAMQTDPLTP